MIILMKPWLHKVEVIVDKSIPYLVLILLILIIGDFTNYKLITENENITVLIDYFIVIIFIIDLSFKYYRIKNAKLFIKKYWLDIIAVFPFFLMFRLVDEVIIFFNLGSEIVRSQEILHTGVEIGRISKELSEEQKVLRELEEATKLERTAKIAEIIRPAERAPRVMGAFEFYEKPYKKKN